MAVINLRFALLTFTFHRVSPFYIAAIVNCWSTHYLVENMRVSEMMRREVRSIAD